MSRHTAFVSVLPWFGREHPRAPLAGGLPRRRAASVALALATAGPILLALALTARPDLMRAIFALLAGGGLLVCAALRPRTAVWLTFLLLPFLALTRRLLIPVAGWQSLDPLLLVAPITGAFLVQDLVLRRGRAIAQDALSRLVLALCALAVLQTLNPHNGGLAAGFAGTLFFIAPFLWFFVGRELLDRGAVALILVTQLALGGLVALYGLWQTSAGLPPWDAAWAALVSSSSYAALNVGGVIRAFGSFSSSAEYAAYLGIALVVALAYLLHGGLLALPLVPLTAAALFLDSSRGVVVLAAVATVVLVGLRTGSRRAAVVVTVALLALALVLLKFAGGGLSRDAALSGNALLAHQVGGLTDPLNPRSSTLIGHVQLVVDGLRQGLTNPVGFGTAAINIGGARFGSTARGTELDISNAFVALGVVGGLLYSAVVFCVLWRVSTLYLLRRDVVVFAVAGVLITTLGQWHNSGYYAVAPLVWLLIGFIAREWDRRGRNAAATPAGREQLTLRRAPGPGGGV